VSFRAAMMDRYGGQCVITGCKIDTLLEAAHIMPYRGNQSDDELNGLLLRVDIHRLFDAHLISINPFTLSVELAGCLNDEAYQAIEGKRLFVFSPKPRALFLEAHYQLFTNKSSSLMR
jgi:predicted restriction endonuclease